MVKKISESMNIKQLYLLDIYLTLFFTSIVIFGSASASL